MSTEQLKMNPQTPSKSTVFEPVAMWARVPHGITFGGDAVAQFRALPQLQPGVAVHLLHVLPPLAQLALMPGLDSRVHLPLHEVTVDVVRFDE